MTIATWHVIFRWPTISLSSFVHAFLLQIMCLHFPQEARQYSQYSSGTVSSLKEIYANNANLSEKPGNCTESTEPHQKSQESVGKLGDRFLPSCTRWNDFSRCGSSFCLASVEDVYWCFTIRIQWTSALQQISVMSIYVKKTLLCQYFVCTL